MNQGILILLARVKTKDGIHLDGIYREGKGKKSTALIWIHGLGSYFYSGQTRTKEIASACTQAGIGYFNFNTRGNNVVSRSSKKYLGAAFERFEDCIWDIKTIIKFAKTRGYKKFILAGHSTGANKAVYYLHKTQDASVEKVILLGPISDISAQTLQLGNKRLAKSITAARKILKKDPQALMPREFGFYSAKRYLSLFEAGHAEDTFPYRHPTAQWRAVSSIRQPLAVIIGSKDKHLDRRATDLIEIFRQKASSARSFSGVIIKSGNHGFFNREKELAETMIKLILNNESRKSSNKN